MDNDSVDYIVVSFYYDNKKICSYRCSNYGEMINFLHYCKKYNVSFYPHEYDTSIPEDISEKLNGVGSYVKDYVFEFGSTEYLPIIRVDLS